MSLTEEQQSVFAHLLQGHNVFLTGGGGVGKSYLISVLEAEFPGRKHQLDSSARIPRVQLCALTGCAALLLGHKAKTLHSWAGIGLGKGTVGELCLKIRRNTKAMRHWLLTDLLIIDEISMMTAELLDKLNDIGKKLRRSARPFGGMQVLLVGDFYQLPPVNRGPDATVFAFESAAWSDLQLVPLELTVIQRQKDEVFQRILNEARCGTLSHESCRILREREGRLWKKERIKPTLLFPRRAEVELINETNLKALKGCQYSYSARLSYDGKQPKGFTESDEEFMRVLDKMDADAAYAKELILMQDSQVMLIANVDADAGLVNGSRGVITGFCPSTDLPMVEFANGVRKPIGTHSWPVEDFPFVSRNQIPLRLAWACTTHKAQGASLDSALVDIGSSNFEFGQAYVALSRARSLDALYVHDFDPASFRAHPKVTAFYQALVRGPLLPLPVVTESEDKPVLFIPSQPRKGIQVIKEPGE